MDNILKDTYSLNQLEHRLVVLKSFLLQKFFGLEKETNPLTEDDSSWLKSLPNDFLNSFNKDNVYKIFEELEKKLTEIHALIIYLTFEPDDSSLTQIGEFARKTFNNPTLILDIKYDPTLVAGTALSWKGIYRDYSLKSSLEQRKQVVLESFKRFLR